MWARDFLLPEDDYSEVPVPWDEYGNLLRTAWVAEGSDIVWKTARPFHATLRLAEYVRGRSWPYVTWLDENDKFYPMGLQDLVELLRTVPVDKGVVTAEWIPHRRVRSGRATPDVAFSYGLRLNLTRSERRIARLGHE